MDLPDPITVLLADDQRAYREGLARAVSEHCRLELVAVARDGEEALEAIESLEPDVALVDVRMTGMEGTTLCEELRRRNPGMATRVILMSAHEGSTLVEHARECGADGYLPKDHSRREICEALVQASQRERVAAPLASADVH
ncbi:MAG TPA: response regulator transcription factor [Thermoleophilaceae bacterium]|nr:response regulator transcription factor [Thermoleophilaceae bacterium]